MGITGFWPSVSANVFSNVSWGLYSREFWENVLVEAHGLLFEIFVIGFILLWLDSRRQRVEYVERNVEHLWDLNSLNEQEVIKKKIGSLKRLNNVSIYKIDVTDLLLESVELKSTIFRKSKLFGLKLIKCTVFDLELTNCLVNSGDFSYSSFKRCNLSGSYLKNANFLESSMKGVDLRNTNLLRARFHGTNLDSADIRGANLKKVVFKNSSLKNANIKMCRNINVEALVQASNLDYIKADEEVINKILYLRPEVKFSNN